MTLTYDTPGKVPWGVLVMPRLLLLPAVTDCVPGILWRLGWHHFNGREQSISLLPFVRCCASGKRCQ